MTEYTISLTIASEDGAAIDTEQLTDPKAYHLFIGRMLVSVRGVIVGQGAEDDRLAARIARLEASSATRLHKLEYRESELITSLAQMNQRIDRLELRVPSSAIAPSPEPEPEPTRNGLGADAPSREAAPSRQRKTKRCLHAHWLITLDDGKRSKGTCTGCNYPVERFKSTRGAVRWRIYQP